MKNAVGPWQPRVEKSSKLMVRILTAHLTHIDTSMPIRHLPSLHVRMFDYKSRSTDGFFPSTLSSTVCSVCIFAKGQVVRG